MLKIGTLFTGIGAPEWALKRMGIPFEGMLACDNNEISIPLDVNKELSTTKRFHDFAKEKEYVDSLYSVSRHAHFLKQTYFANFPSFDPNRYFLDVRLLDGAPLKGSIDILVGGSPCQSFSIVGAQKGLDDVRGTLFYQYCRLVREIRPKVFIYENVNGIIAGKNKESWKEMYGFISHLGYQTFQINMNARDYGIPQVRNRVFVVGFHQKKKIPSFSPATIPLNYQMKDFLEDSIRIGGFLSDGKGGLSLSFTPGPSPMNYALSPAVERYVMTPGTKNFKTVIKTDLPVARTLLSTMGNHHRAGVDNYITVSTEPLRHRSLTPRECLRLMGFTDDYQIVVSRAQAYKQIGNSMVVDVLIALFKEIFRIEPNLIR